HQYVFVGLFHTPGVDSFHIVMVDECTQDRFYCAATAFGQKTCVVFVFVQLFVHLVIQRLMKTVFNLFEPGDFSTTLCSERSISAIILAYSIACPMITFTSGHYAFNRQISLVASFFDTFVTVFFFVEHKSFSFRFILSEVWHIGIDVFLLAIL